MTEQKLTAEESKQAFEMASLYTNDRVKQAMQTAEKKKKVKTDVDTDNSTSN